jgi:hypothetical protein
MAHLDPLYDNLFPLYYRRRAGTCLERRRPRPKPKDSRAMLGPGLSAVKFRKSPHDSEQISA